MKISQEKYKKDVAVMKNYLSDIKVILKRIEKRRNTRRKVLVRLARENQIYI